MPPKNDKLLAAYEQLISMLRPETNMSGLISTVHDEAMPKYRVPVGLTEKQAMLVVLGAILQKENLMKMGTNSSSGSIPRLEWTKHWFLRDFRADEGRGFAVQDTVAAGRRQAMEAFAAMENGDRSQVDKLLKDAADGILDIVDREEVKDSYLWDNPESALRLLDEATAEGGIEEATGYGKEAQAKLELKNSLCQILTWQRDLSAQYTALPDDAPQELRSSLLASIYACSAILRSQYERSFMAPSRELIPIMPEDPEPMRKGGDLVGRSLEVQKQVIQFHKDYVATHPDAVERLIKTDEGRATLLNAYQKAIRETDHFKKAAPTKVRFFNFPYYIKLQVDLPEVVTPEERVQLDEQWQQKKQAHTGKLKEQAERALNLEARTTKRLKEIADEHNLNDLIIIGNEQIPEHYDNPSVILMNGLDLYVADRDMNKIYRVSMGFDNVIRAEKVDSVTPAMGATTVAPAYIYADEFKKAFLASDIAMKEQGVLKTVAAAAGKPEGAGLAEIAKQYHELRREIRELVQGSTEERANAVAQRAEQIKASATALLESGKLKFSAKVAMEELQKFSTSVLEAKTAADQRIRELDEKKSIPVVDPAVAANRVTRAKERAAENERREADHVRISDIVKPVPPASRDTEIRLNLNPALELLAARVPSDPEQAQKYNAYLDTLRQLSNETAALYQRDADGNYPPMTQEAYNRLLAVYGKALGQNDEVRSEGSDSSARDTVLRELSGILTRDFAMLTSIDPTLERSLPEVVANRRVRRIDITGKEFSTVGANSNVRYAMEVMDNGTGRKGFLTTEERLEFPRSAYEEQFAPAIRDYPEYAGILKRVLNEMYETGALVLADPIHSVVQYCDRNNLLTGLLDPDLEGNKEAQLQNLEKTLALTLKDANFQDLVTKHTQYRGYLHATEGSSITNRNAAMSKAANLLGIPTIIAHSEIVETVNNGKVEKAVIMDAANGIDHDAIMPEDVANANEKTGDSPNLLKQIAQLQILDYICGNVDRHQNNFFYQFTNHGEKLVGIQGLDNDCSFHTVRKKDGEFLSTADININGLQVIPKELAEKLRSLTPASIRAAMSDTNIGDKEIANIYLNAQDVVKAIDANKIRVVEDNEWEKLDLNKLGEQEHSLFQTVKTQVNNLQKTAQANLANKQKKERKKQAAAENPEAAPAEPEKKPFGFEKAEVVDGVNAASLAMDARSADGFASRITVSQGSIHGSGSPEFRALEKAVQNYQKLLGTVAQNPTDKGYRMLQASLESIDETAQAYMDVKAGKKLSQKTQKRVTIAREAQEFARKRGEDFKKALHRQDEIRVEDTNAQVKAQAEAIHRALDSTDKLGKKFLEIASNENEPNEIRMMMMLGISALEQVTNSITRVDVTRLAAKNNNALPALLMCATMVDSRSVNNGKAGDLEQAVVKLGAAKTLTNLDNSPKMVELKKNLTVKQLTEMTGRKFRDVLPAHPAEKKPEVHQEVKQVEANHGLQH